MACFDVTYDARFATAFSDSCKKPYSDVDVRCAWAPGMRLRKGASCAQAASIFARDSREYISNKLLQKLAVCGCAMNKKGLTVDPIKIMEDPLSMCGSIFAEMDECQGEHS
jgi:hypothetical protein